MLAIWTLLPMVAVAATVGPFSGVSIDKLMDTPILSRDGIFTAVGEQLTQYTRGLKMEQVEGQSVGTTQQDFAFEVELDLKEAARYRITVEAKADTSGQDSYWLVLDGVQSTSPLTISRAAIAEASQAFEVTAPGKHRVGLILREGPGSVLRSVRVDTLRVKSPQAPLRPELAAKHPRLLLTEADLPILRNRMATEAGKRFYKLPSPLTRKPPAYKTGSRNGGGFRDLGSYALGHLLQPDPAQLAGVTAWLEEATKYPDCGVDLDAEYFIEGVALAYDWLYNYLSEDLRQRVRDTIVRQCKVVYEASLSNHAGGGLSYQQNHYWYSHLSLALGAAAVYGEVPEAANWLAWAWDRYERTALTIGTDGGFHEGPSYWDFSMPTLYLFTDLYEWCTGLHAPDIDRGLPGQIEFRFRHLYPGFGLTAPLEDTSQTLGRPAVKLALWEARRFKDPLAMGLADLLVTSPGTDRFNLLWLDEKLVGTEPLAKLALSKRYDDVETVFARTSWGPEATFAAFVCRPLGGHLYAELCERYGIGGTGHNHPEEGHFVLFGRGETLAGDTGYTYAKRTNEHNTVLVDGKGQYGDGEMWPVPNKGRARITRFATDKDMMIVTGDATSAYPEELGLTQFERTFVMAGRDLCVVYDRLQAREPRTFSWLLTHKGTVASGKGQWTVTRGEAKLTIAPLLPAGLTAREETYRPQFVHPTRDLTPKDPEFERLSLDTGPVTQTTFLVPLLISGAGETPVPAVSVKGENCDAVQAGQIVVAFRKAPGEMTVRAPWGEEVRSGAAVMVLRLQGADHQVLEAR